jgi:hypothetical protein
MNDRVIGAGNCRSEAVAQYLIGSDGDYINSRWGKAAGNHYEGTPK